MRSVILHFWGTDEAAVAAMLDRAYPTQGRPWVREVNDDPCLYIDFYRDGPVESDDWGTRFLSKGGPPIVSVVVDISGRHEGWAEVQEIASCLLGHLDGVAEDDGALRLWTLDEIKEDRTVGGKKFGYWRT